jgi:hypothetical protein
LPQAVARSGSRAVETTNPDLVEAIGNVGVGASPSLFTATTLLEMFVLIASPTVKTMEKNERLPPHSVFLCLKSSVAIILAIVATASGCAGWHHPRESRSRWLKGVSQSDRVKLRALREMVKNDPAVRAADEKRKRANDEYHEALRAAILKRDPTLATILDKIRERREQSKRAKSD